MERPLVLIIDDAALNHEIVCDILKEADYRVASAFNREEAFALISEEQPDLILLDIIMPGTDGHEICIQLKESMETKEIPIIFLTAKTGDDDIIWGFQLGAVDYIKKPFNSQELLARVITHVDLKRSKDEQKKLIQELETAVHRVKQLSGLLPICSHCKNVRDDHGYWTKVEKYLFEHANVEITHSLCPHCVKELYPDIAEKIFHRE